MGRGTHSDSTRGSKPAIAFESERLARENIQSKLRIITVALNEKNEKEAITGLPTSTRQFNLWSPVRPSGEQLNRNSNETLSKYEDLRLSVQQAVSAVKLACQPPAHPNSRGERLASARRSLQMHKRIREIAERELVRARMEVHDLKGTLEIRTAQLSSAQAEARAMLDAASLEVSRLQSENSRLTQALAKIAPLRKV